MTTTAPLTSRADHRISAADAADMVTRHREGVLPELAVFDVRDPARYAAAHVEGALHLTEAGFLTVARSLPKTTPVLVYCYHGNASKTYAQMFADFRYPEVYSVDGGYEVFAAAITAQAAGQKPPAGPRKPGPELAAFLARHRFDPFDLDAPREHGLTPLMRAALEGDADIVGDLLTLRVSVARRNMDGNNALWLACVAGKAEIVRQLVAAGIDVDNRNDMGATCLMYAASAGKPEMVALLLECGADPQIPNFDDARAVDLAATRECLELLRHTLRPAASAH